MKAGDLVQYNSRLLLVLEPNPDEYGYNVGLICLAGAYLLESS
jgi:hypothetical protein